MKLIKIISLVLVSGVVYASNVEDEINSKLDMLEMMIMNSNVSGKYDVDTHNPESEPVVIITNENGQIEYKHKYSNSFSEIDDDILSEDGVVVLSNPSKHLYINGEHVWRQNGLLHNDFGPAYINRNGDRFWLKYGRLHRVGAPAIITRRGSRFWYRNGRLVNNGTNPAYIKWTGKMVWVNKKSQIKKIYYKGRWLKKYGKSWR
jgi:hypothetical protein